MSAAGCIIRDVFRQARASGLTAALVAVSLCTAALCCTLSWTPTADYSATELSLGFGTWPITAARNLESALAHFQFFLAGMIADTAGVLLALIWTSGFLPSFLDPGSASVLLSKPTSRSLLFAARWFAVLLYVAVFGLVFVGASWLAVGMRTQVWTAEYWVCVPILVAHFATFYAFSALLAVVSRNATVCIVGSIVFWALCWAMNFGRHAIVGMQVEQASAGLGRLVDLAYWVMPKPADFSLILADTIGADDMMSRWTAFKAVREAGLFHPWAAVLSSLAAGAVFLGLAAYEFVHDEY